MIKQEILDRYNQIVVSNMHLVSAVEIKCMEGDELNPIHLLWMLKEIELNQEQSLTKKHRWLGFVQGVIITKGWTTVLNERDATRDAFDGN